ncbi:MAG: Gldg family protein [Phycisphaeraceae bacterium]|nr:MAG: Gldg family protein [Phycisphaeraceae bacterium]
MSRFVGLISLVLLAALFLGLNVAADHTLSGARLDLTEGRLYTLRPASGRIAKSPEEPIRFRFYYSKDLARGIPQYESFGRHVFEMLESFSHASGGKIKLDVINPEPFSDAEDEAVAEGLKPTPISPTDNLYMGLVATNSLDGHEVIPLFRPDEERFLEYRIAQLITKLAKPDKPKLGLLTGLPMTGGFDQRMQRPTGEWVVLSELKASFDVEMIEPTADELPGDLDALMVVHPKGITPKMMYAIDQYVLGGGKAVIYVDPVCEADQDQQSQMGMQFGRDRSSNLPGLFGAWGVTLADGKLAGDMDLAIQVQLPGPVPERVPYLIWLTVGPDELAKDDPVTGNLTRLNIASAGYFERADDAAVTWEPLIETTDHGGPVDRAKAEMAPDPKGLLSDFVPGDHPLVIAARLTGEPKTAFPDGPPEAKQADDSTADADTKAADTEKKDAESPDQIMQASKSINVIVVADTDLLADGGWVQEQRLGGVLLGYNVYADNGAFAVNAAEQMAGSTDLLEVRGRGTFVRPFKLLEQMQRDAEAEFLATEQTLQDEINQTRQRINDLQSARSDSSTASLVLTPEQEAEIDRLNKVLADKRKELREVQLNLRKDIKKLENRIKLIDTGLVPVLLCVFALSLGGYRAVRRRADRKRGSER